MKDFPLSEPGGNSPVVAYFSASMIVVLPVPFGPRMSVNGQEKRIAASSLSSPKLRIPRSDSQRILDIFHLGKRDSQYLTAAYKYISYLTDEIIYAVNIDQIRHFVINADIFF